jgi:hypothetical protein
VEPRSRLASRRVEGEKLIEGGFLAAHREGVIVVTAGPTRPNELLQALVAADRDVWSPEGPGSAIDLRNDAAKIAIAAGWLPEELAEILQVRPDDVRRWASP